MIPNRLGRSPSRGQAEKRATDFNSIRREIEMLSEMEMFIDEEAT